jgi:hypothetical protein
MPAAYNNHLKVTLVHQGEWLYPVRIFWFSQGSLCTPSPYSTMDADPLAHCMPGPEAPTAAIGRRFGRRRPVEAFMQNTL